MAENTAVVRRNRSKLNQSYLIFIDESGAWGDGKNN